MIFFLETERLGFRWWRREDLPLARGLWGDAAVTRFTGGPLSEEAVEARLAGEIVQAEACGMQYWPIFLRSSGEHVGCAGLRPHDAQERVLEMGYHLRRAFWGQGLATEAARAVIGHAFATLGAAALFAGHHPANQASRQVLRKLGFVWTGEQLYPPTGWMEPTYLLRREAWERNSGAPCAERAR